MEIVGIDELLKIKISPHMEMFQMSLDNKRLKIINREKDKEEKYEEEEKRCIKLILDTYPEINALYELEKVYGPFHIFCDLRFDIDYEDVLCEMLFDLRIFYMESASLKFCNKYTHTYLETNCVYGTNIIGLCREFINKCMNSDNLIRYINEEGEGYATTNVREIIMNSGVKLGCIS